jgi:hypothetical protein
LEVRGLKIKFAILLLAVVFISASAGAGSTPPEKPVARVLAAQIYPGDLEPDSKTLENLRKSVPEAELPDALAEYRRNRLSELIWQPLQKKFIEELNIRVSEGELDDFANAMIASKKEMRDAYERKIGEWQDELKKEGLPAAKKSELEQRIKRLRTFLSAGKEKQVRAYREIGRRIVERWKVNRELYAVFGGAVVLQQGGPEPVGAYRAFLEREEKDSEFEIYQKELRDRFWAYYSRKQPFAIPNDKVDFTTPWWLMAKPKEVK